MGSNTFGKHFCVTTWGESHGKAIGVVVDGCPAGLPITVEEIQQELIKRSPGRSAHTSPRQEADRVELLSGLFEGVTTGAPISLMIWNKDQDSSKYDPIKNLMRPGHANFTYLNKYGIFDYRGGGRASARETAARVAAGAIAKKLLARENIEIIAHLKQVGTLCSTATIEQVQLAQDSSFFWADSSTEKELTDYLNRVMEAGDSIGACVECYVKGLPVGLGEPVYEKLEAKLAFAMLSLPASKGFEIGEGFNCVTLLGSENNEGFYADAAGAIHPENSNHAGGTLAGISTGAPVLFRVAFKPTSSIKLPQKTVDLEGNEVVFLLPEGSRHDPCVGIRAVPVVICQTALVIADLLLSNRLSRC